MARASQELRDRIANKPAVTASACKTMAARMRVSGMSSRMEETGTSPAIAVDMHDYQTDAVDPSFHFAVKADGSSASP